MLSPRADLERQGNGVLRNMEADSQVRLIHSAVVCSNDTVNHQYSIICKLLTLGLSSSLCNCIHTPLHVGGSAVEVVPSYKYLSIPGTYIVVIC